MPRIYTRRPLAERFWEKVDVRGPDECWPWKAGTYPQGYGQFCIHHGLCVGAHRIAYELVKGPIPAGMKVCHNCPGGDNRACCNPTHLWPGTDLDNHRDSIAKGRRACGERHGMHKLTEAQVREIRRLAAEDNTQTAIGRCMGVTPSNIEFIVRGVTWRHLL